MWSSGHRVVIWSPCVRVRNDTDIGIDIGDTGISLPTPIQIRGIADLTIRKKDNYYAFAYLAYLCISRSDGTH